MTTAVLAAAPCRSDPDRWANAGDDPELKRICRLECPRRSSCAQEALTTPGVHGVVAGIFVPPVDDGSARHGISRSRENALTRLGEVARHAAKPAEATRSPVLNMSQAKVLDTQIRAQSTSVASGIEGLLRLLKRAAAGRIHKVLGFRSLADYFSAAVKVRPAGVSERRQMVEAMYGEGLSYRAIAAALGIGVGTVNRDLADAVSGGANVAGVPNGTPDRQAEAPAGVPNGTPEPAVTTGIDGKQYPRQPKDEPAEQSSGMPECRGQAKALRAAREALTKASKQLDAAFPDDIFDTDITAELVTGAVSEISAAAGRIDRVARHIGSKFCAGTPPDRVVVPMIRSTG